MPAGDAGIDLRTSIDGFLQPKMTTLFLPGFVASCVTCFVLHSLSATVFSDTIAAVQGTSRDSKRKDPLPREIAADRLSCKIKFVATLHAFVSTGAVAYVMLTRPQFLPLADAFFSPAEYWWYGIALFVGGFLLQVLMMPVLPGMVSSLISPSLHLAALGWAVLKADFARAQMDFVNVEAQQTSTLLVAGTCGYFMYDFILMIYEPMVSSPGMLVHHIGSLLVWPIAVAEDQLVFFVLIFIAYEVSTPMLHYRWILLNTGRKSSKLYVPNGLLLLVTFYIARVLSAPPLLCAMHLSRDALLTMHPVHQVLSLAILVPIVLNLVWFEKLWGGAMKAIRGMQAKTRPPKKDA